MTCTAKKEWEEHLRLQWEGAESDDGGKSEQNKKNVNIIIVYF